MATLFVIRGNDQGIRFELEGTIFQLGRDSSNFIQLHDSEVSRHHAEIRRRDDEYLISDLNSSNGTFVNGQRIEQHKLESGDQVQTGSTLMLFTGPLDEASGSLAATGEHQSRPGVGRLVADRQNGHAGGRQPDPRLPRRHAAKFLARPGAEQSADHVPHGAGREPHARHRPTLAADHGVDFRVGRGRPRLRDADGPRQRRRSSPACGARGRASRTTTKSTSARRSSTT